MLHTARVTFVATVVLAGGVTTSTSAANLIGDARVTLAPPAQAADAAAAALADPALEAWVGWEPAAEGPMSVRVEWDGWAPVDTVVCHWRLMPADYTLELRVDGGWTQVADIAGNAVRDHKIALHQFPTVRARALRLVIAGPVGAAAGVSLRALEAYAKADPPPAVAAFLARQTPQLLESRGSVDRWRAEHDRDPLDEELLAREIPTWEPIPQSLYGGQETGRVVNEKAGARASLRAALSLRYAQTGRVQYAQRAWQVMAAIVDHYDRWQAFRFVGRGWQAVTFQEPGYMLNSLPRQYERIAEALDDTQKLRVLYFLTDVADFQYRAILEFMPTSEHVTRRGQLPNWMPNSIGGLAMTAVMLRDFPQSRAWVQACDDRIGGFFKDIFFLTDGTWWECSPAHHVYVLRGLYPYALARHLLGEPVWDREYDGLTIADTLEALAKTANPAGEYPSVNDSYGNDAPIRSAHPELVEAATVMGRGDILYAWHAQPRWPDIPAITRTEVTLVPPDYTSVNQQASGMAVMRDGWDPEDAWLLMDYGPHGGGHGQYDKLSIIMFDDGHHWVPDAGCAPHYSIFPEQGSWHRQTISHNTVLVDGKSQQATEGRLLAWHSEEALDFVCAEHDGYPTAEGPLILGPATEERTLTVRPREAVPLRLAQIELVGDGDVREVLAPEDAQLAGARLVEDEAAPGGAALEFTEASGRATWTIPALPAGRSLRATGMGRDTSHDSLWVELDGGRLGQVALGVGRYETLDGVGQGFVRHRRAIVHPRGEYFLIHDRLTATDDQAHTAEFLLHVYGEVAGEQRGRIIFRHGERRLAVHSALIGDEPPAIEQGLCGGMRRSEWHGEGYPGPGDPGWILIPFLRLPQPMEPERGRVDFFTVLQAFEGDAPPGLVLEALVPEDGEEAGVCVRSGETRDVYLAPRDGRGRARFTRTRAGAEVLVREFELASAE